MKKKLLSMVLTLALALSFFALPVSAAKAPVSEGKKLYVTGTKNFLALRSKPEYKASNEIAKIYNGETLKVQLSNRSGAYLWAKYEGKQGWVNGDYVRK